MKSGAIDTSFLDTRSLLGLLALAAAGFVAGCGAGPVTGEFPGPPAAVSANEQPSSLDDPAVDGGTPANDPEEPAQKPVTGAPGQAPPGTTQGGRHVSLRPSANTSAADPMHHWGRRQNGPIATGLAPVPEFGDPVGDFRALRDAARAGGDAPVVPDLRDGDAVAALGHDRGVRYGRWSGGPADTLSIRFDLSEAGYELRNDDAFRAALARAGKTWSRRIADTWRSWEREAGDIKGWSVGDDPDGGGAIRVGYGGETSTGVVIHVTEADLGGDIAASARGGPVPPGDVWEPHFGAIGFDKDYLDAAGEASLFATMVHEIGHVLGAWNGTDDTEAYAPYTDAAAGVWTGPHVTAVHGGPAPFQDESEPHAWVEGARNPGTVDYDTAHSGLCVSVMSYCSQRAAIPAFVPAELDFAFLKDLGLTIIEADERPETYGLAGWMDHAAFTVSVARELRVTLADPQPRYAGQGAPWQTLDTLDLLRAEADAFGYRSAGRLADSYPPGGTVRYSGGLIGAAVDYPGLPPVRGDADLSIDLADMNGSASFTSLWVLHDGSRYRFGDGSLHYSIAVTDEGIAGGGTSASLAAAFHVPAHEEVAGTLDDYEAGLIASFGAARDQRPDYRDVIAAADRVRGLTYQAGSADTEDDGWRGYRCAAGPSCEARRGGSDGWGDWHDVAASDGETPRERVLDRTSGWGPWLDAVPVADHDGIRIARHYQRRTDGGRGRYESDGYFGTMEHAAFGTRFYGYAHWETGDGSVSDFHRYSTGFQGALSGARPDDALTWEGRMVGFQFDRESGEDPFVQGQASVRFSPFFNNVDVRFSDVTSRDGERRLPFFGFDAIPVAPDGTFNGWDEGLIEGAFFGPSHQEAAGLFHHNGRSVIGSFGAVAPDAAVAGNAAPASGGN